MRRKRVDWDEELKKSERIRRKGFGFTAAGFILAIFWLLGARQMQKGLSFLPMLFSIIMAACGVFLFLIMIHKKNSKKD